MYNYNYAHSLVNMKNIVVSTALVLTLSTTLVSAIDKSMTSDKILAEIMVILDGIIKAEAVEHQENLLPENIEAEALGNVKPAAEDVVVEEVTSDPAVLQPPKPASQQVPATRDTCTIREATKAPRTARPEQNLVVAEDLALSELQQAKDDVGENLEAKQQVEENLEAKQQVDLDRTLEQALENQTQYWNEISSKSQSRSKEVPVDNMAWEEIQAKAAAAQSDDKLGDICTQIVEYAAKNGMDAFEVAMVIVVLLEDN